MLKLVSSYPKMPRLRVALLAIAISHFSVQVAAQPSLAPKLIPAQKDSLVNKAFARYVEYINRIPRKPSLTDRELHTINTELKLLKDKFVAALAGTSETTRICVIEARDEVSCLIRARVSYPRGVQWDSRLDSYHLALQKIFSASENESIDDDGEPEDGTSRLRRSVCVPGNTTPNNPLWKLRCSIGTDSILFFAGDTVVITGIIDFPSLESSEGLVNGLRFLWFSSQKQATTYTVKQREQLARLLELQVRKAPGASTSEHADEIFPAQITSYAMFPMPVPSRVRPYTMVARFDVDEQGKATLIDFNPSKDEGYNRRIREMLLSYRFRPAERSDRTLTRDTVTVTISFPREGPVSLESTSRPRSVSSEKLDAGAAVRDFTPVLDLSEKLRYEVQGRGRSQSATLSCGSEVGVSPRSSSDNPRYPEILLSAGVKGQVLAQFIVDSVGRVESGSVKVIRSDHELFSASVRSFLGSTKPLFIPAECDGVKVRQAVQQAFEFNLRR